MTRLLTQKFGATVAAIGVTIAVFQTIAIGMQTTAGQSQTVASGAVESSVPRAVSRTPQAACLGVSRDSSDQTPSL
jgi:hypothetical protein